MQLLQHEDEQHLGEEVAPTAGAIPEASGWEIAIKNFGCLNGKSRLHA